MARTVFILAVIAAALCVVASTQAATAAAAAAVSSSSDFGLAAWTCNVTMPPDTPLVINGGKSLLYPSWHALEFDAMTMDIMKVAKASIGSAVAVMSETTGISMFADGSILNPAGFTIYDVDLTTLTVTPRVKLQGVNNNTMFNTMDYVEATQSVYATVIECFMCSANVFAEIDINTGKLLNKVKLTSGSDDSAGLAPPTFNAAQTAAYFWVNSTHVAAVSIPGLAVTYLESPTPNGNADMAPMSPVAMVEVGSQMVISYLNTTSMNATSMAFWNVETGGVFFRDLPYPEGVKQLLPYGPVAWSGTSFHDSYVYTVLSYFGTLAVYRLPVSRDAPMHMYVRDHYMFGSDALLVPNGASVYVMFMEGLNATAICDHSSFIMGRIGPSS